MAAIWNTVTVASGQTVVLLRDDFLDDTVAYEFQSLAPGATPQTLINHGDIRFTATYAFQPDIVLLTLQGHQAYRTTTVENHGSILVDAKVGYATGLAAGGVGTPGFINTGDFVVRAQLEAAGLWFWGSSVNNSGKILVEAGAGAYAISLDGGGGSGGLIRNTGSIVANVTGAGDSRAILVRENDLRIENDGLIAATHSSAAGSSIAISFGVAGVGPLQIINRGTITGDSAIRESGGVPNPSYPSVQQIENYGTINGQISLGVDGDTLVNAGLINGAVDLGAQGDLYDGRLGRVTGMVAGGEGGDTLRGGDSFDYLQGNAGADTVAGGLGDDWVVGGKDSDRLSGDAGDDLVYGNMGADTASGGDGVDWIRGGQDNDSLTGEGDDDLIWGDRGDDTVSGGAGADTFGTFVGAGLDRILDFSAAAGDRVRIEGGATYSVRTQGADTVVDLGNGDIVLLVGVDLSSTTGWIFRG